MHALERFLMRNTIQEVPPLPLVHSTQAALLKQFVARNAIIPAWCDVFKREASYFFVGRPAYKKKLHDEEIGYWQLPVCFIFEFDAVPGIDTVYPFDTGAHAQKRMPEFVQMFEREEYRVPASRTGVSRLIGSVFADALDYFRLQPKPRRQFNSEFSLGVFDEEIHALHMLASSRRTERLDDRRLCVEVQTKEIVSLDQRGLLAVVCPNAYLDDPTFLKHVETVWKAEPISYPVLPLSYDNYVGNIYEKVFSYYRSRGLLPDD